MGVAMSVQIAQKVWIVVTIDVAKGREALDHMRTATANFDSIGQGEVWFSAGEAQRFFDGLDEDTRRRHMVVPAELRWDVQRPARWGPL